MESQLTCEACLQAGNITTNEAHVLTSCSDHIAPKAPAKKRTRKWAAWTRQEEESFFNALRQVGKNFEKITYHVQSKNKDQVRHYYYRLIRRMNKLLGPDFCLDAKNSKDTNAAMLRWWSLLEKHSCRASKLHLKPRRFKIFIDALAHQLLKDRRKSMRRHSMPGENVVATAVSNQKMVFGHDTHEVKVVVVDGQDIQKFGSRRVLSSRCSRKGPKGEPSTFKTTKPQRKTAAYRKWKTAAIAGVSLVADAAEHLERTDILRESVQVQNSSGQMNLDTGEDLTLSPSVPENLLGQNDAKNPMKLKLQLFPVDEGTRRALEMDRCNPHLELTLSSRKKISSVLEHLNQKWGNSSIASGKIMLFPYNIQKEDLVACPSWSKDSGLTATDLHKLIGRPSIFRLRYGWILNSDPIVFTSELSSISCLNSSNTTAELLNEKQLLLDSTLLSPSKNTAETSQNQRNSVMEESAPSPSCPSGGISNETFHHANAPLRKEVSATYDSVAYRSCLGMVDAAATTVIEMDNDNLITCEVRKASTQEWIDGNTNISIGDLLSGVEDPHEMDIDAGNTCIERSPNFQPTPFISDSFDVAVAAHLSKHQDSVCYQHSVAPHTSSIWNAEETCDAFSFKKKSEGNQGAPNLERNACADSSGQNTGCLETKDFPEEEVSIENPVVDILDGDRSSQLKDLTDIYWPDSLGPLDLDIRSCRYHSDDMILCDSLGALNHLLAGSLDSFQNCSFGMNTK